VIILNHRKLLFSLSIILLISVILIQQIQIYNLYTRIESQEYKQSIAQQTPKEYLIKNYGVETIEELIEKKLKEYGLRYTGNPFTTALYPGQLQAENITFMHGYWYNPATGQLENKTDIWAHPEQTATFIIFKDGDGNVYAKNTTSGQIEFGGAQDAGEVDGANASAVINACINALSSNGGSVFLKKGEYSITLSSAGAIQLNSISNFIFRGEGKGLTIIKSDGSGSGYMLTGSTINNVTIQGITFDNLLGAQSGVGNIMDFGASNITDLTIIDCELLNAYGFNFVSIGINSKRIRLIRNVWSKYSGTHAGNDFIDIAGSEHLIAYNEFYNPSSTASAFITSGGPLKDTRILFNYINSSSFEPAITLEGGSNDANDYAYENILIEGTITTKLPINIGGGGTGSYAGNKIIVTNNFISNIAVSKYSKLIQIKDNVFCQTGMTGAAGRNVLNLDGFSGGSVIFINNEIYDVADGTPVYLPSGATIDYLEVRNNRFVIETGSYGGTYLHQLRGTVNGLIFENNYYEGYPSPLPSNLLDGTITVIRVHNEPSDFFGLLTENKGVARNLANGGWIAHGLSGTPDHVQLTSLNATYDGVAVLVYWDQLNTNSTHIAVDIYWSNGTAITDNVIAVSWNAGYQP